jgi:PAS domain S-box-containing protein
MSDAMTRLRGIAEQLFSEGYLQQENIDPLFSDESDRLLLVASAEGRCLRANSAWMKHLGYSRQRIEGSSYFDFIHPDDQLDSKKVAADMSEEGVTSFQNRYRTANGNYRWLSWSASRYDKNGTTYAVADVVTDPDELLRLEQLAQQRSVQTRG